jgi:hypothetical protein
MPEGQPGLRDERVGHVGKKLALAEVPAQGDVLRVIRFDHSVASLTPEERFGLDVLVDLSRLAIVTDQAADVVTVRAASDIEPGIGVDQWLCGLDGWRRGLVRGDGSIAIARHVLRCITAVAGAGAEQLTTARDRYGRVPSAENPLVRAGEDRERDPVVSIVAGVFREMVIEAAGRRQVRTVAPWPDGREWAAAFTHDVDVVAGWPAFTALRLVELAKKGRWSLVRQVLSAAMSNAVRDPAWRGVADVIAAERGAGTPSTWFFLCGTPTLGTWRRGDLTYRPESKAVRRIVDALAEASRDAAWATVGGAEIGLHGSFATFDGGEAAFSAQRRRLAAATVSSGPAAGVRQHYLRIWPGPTQRAMAATGFDYDATFGFPDRNGFRLGVADVVPAWDAESRVALPMDEVPLHWMDRALSKYRGVEEPSAWIDDALALARTCRGVGGLWVGLWHCNLTPPLGFPGAPAAYRRLLSEIMVHAPWVAPLSTIVAWRRFRRAARVTAVAPDGRCAVETVAATGGGPFTVQLREVGAASES